MDYKEKLKEALNSDNTDYEVVRWIEQTFPELKESDDEKIRKHLIKHFGNKSKEDWNGVPVKSILAWLKKQGEHANFRNKIQTGDNVTRNEDGVLVNLSQLNRVAKKQGEQKPWSEEDEDILNTIINHFKVDIECTDEDDTVRWLKSLKERVGHFDDGYKVGFSAAKYHQWKPSDEQMAALEYYLRSVIDKEGVFGRKMVELYEDLWNLREE